MSFHTKNKNMFEHFNLANILQNKKKEKNCTKKITKGVAWHHSKFN